jgi:tetrapyrrole methylase family protein/MazG family protein
VSGAAGHRERGGPPAPSPASTAAGQAFARLVELVAALRGPDGCPWDRAQTRASVTPYLVEETYETVDALQADDPAAIREELGDLLFQVLFHADMAREAGDFTVADVIEAIQAKMVHRHPHVFGDAVAETPEAVLENWDALKAAEPGKQARESVLDGVPRSLPALLRAYKVSKRAARAGFDWDRAEDVWPKVHEELDELKEALEKGDLAHAEDELGDVMFALVNLGRKADLPAEEALTGTVERFCRRFAHMEGASGKPLEELTLGQWQDLWQAAKAAVG